MNDWKLFKSIILPFIFIATLWLLKLFQIANNWDLSFMGVLPRSLGGLLGIITGPLVHGVGFDHLISNTVPLMILGVAIFYFYDSVSLRVIPIIYVGSTIVVWLFARPHNHIGASGVVYGMAAFLLFSGFLRKDRASLAITFLVIFLYGGMLWGVLPGRVEISWESHLAGALIGTVLAFVYKNKDKIEFEWQKEEEDEFDWDQTPFNP